MAKLMQTLKFAEGIDPVADAFSGTVNSDVYSMKDHGCILFVIYAGVGATGTSTITVEACDNVTPSNTTAIPFYSREVLTGDTDSVITKRAAAGFTNTAGSSKIVQVEAHKEDMASTGYSYIRLHAVESVDSPVLGGVMAILGGAPNRYNEDINTSVIV